MSKVIDLDAARVARGFTVLQVSLEPKGPSGLRLIVGLILMTIAMAIPAAVDAILRWWP